MIIKESGTGAPLGVVVGKSWALDMARRDFQDCSVPGGPAVSFLRSELLLIVVLSIPREATVKKKARGKWETNEK